MIVEGWYELERAIDKAVPCYTPVESPPYGWLQRCGNCEGCLTLGPVEDALSLVERNIERAIDDAYVSGIENATIR
jgi:hypothetical protein